MVESPVEELVVALRDLVNDSSFEDETEGRRAPTWDTIRAARSALSRFNAERGDWKPEDDTPEVNDFMRGTTLEAAHQRKRWGSKHDAGKTSWDWFWLVGYLAQKAATSANAGDFNKAKHHTISTAAALANWHAALSGENNEMRPGIDPGHPTRPNSAAAMIAAINPEGKDE